jgi:hypothetical protein
MLVTIFTIWAVMGGILLLIIAINIKRDSFRESIYKAAEELNINVLIMLVLFFCIGFYVLPASLYKAIIDK